MIVPDTIEQNYSELSLEKKKLLYQTYKDPATRKELQTSLQNILFKKIPPTGKQFLDPQNEWLPKNVIDSIYPLVEQDFLDIVDGGRTFTQLSFYGSTRQGKTFLSRLLIIYTIIFIHHLREPALYYNLSPLTDLCIYFISFKFDKTRQLYLKPVYKILERSKRFVLIKFQDQVAKEQEKYSCEKIVYSKAATVGEITLASGLQIVLGNDSPNEIIGADIIQCYISEIAFFIEEAGATEEQIYQLYTDALDRVNATVGKDYLTWIFLDTSANYADSLIETHIIKDLQLDPDTFFRWRSRWDIRPFKFPKWYKGVQELEKLGVSKERWNVELYQKGLAFKVISGNGDIPAKLVTTEQDCIGIPKDLIIYVPIDIKKQFEDALIKSIKDIAGVPTSNESKFISTQSSIDNLFSLTALTNIEGGVVADAADSPSMLLFNKVKDLLITTYSHNNTPILKRAPREPRFVALDVAHSMRGDVYGFCMAHPEWSREKETTMVIADLCFAILPGSEGINLTAVEQFILDMVEKGNIPIFKVTADSFQSRQTIQNIQRANIETEVLSVDTSLNPYQELLSALLGGTVKCGKNIFLKNNLSCLERVRNEKHQEKIDHPKGPTVNQYHGDWNISKAGINAKDCSDTLAAVTYTILSSKIISSTVYEDENARHRGDAEYSNKVIAEKYKKIWRVL